jgi:hypothetical protein
MGPTPRCLIRLFFFLRRNNHVQWFDINDLRPYLSYLMLDFLAKISFKVAASLILFYAPGWLFYGFSARQP